LVNVSEANVLVSLCRTYTSWISFFAGTRISQITQIQGNLLRPY